MPDRIDLRDGTGNPTIILNGASADGTFGGSGQDGRVFVRDKDGKRVMLFDGTSGDATLGGEGKGGRLFLRDRNGILTAVINGSAGDVVLGGRGQAGQLFLQNNEGRKTLHLDGQAGDIILENADCAEDFPVAEVCPMEAGDVAVFDGHASLRKCDRPYDKRVAGVISGGADLKPGLILGRNRPRQDRLPLALIGRVYCNVDAQFGPVEIGDLLTTSSTPGHAMKASDPFRSFGAVIGKALQSLREGRGLIPILVALQ
jgi:hypothetical protein